jgi:hypothetical protein
LLNQSIFKLSQPTVHGLNQVVQKLLLLSVLVAVVVEQVVLVKVLVIMLQVDQVVVVAHLQYELFKHLTLLQRLPFL